jgi:hypothetical protein
MVFSVRLAGQSFEKLAQLGDKNGNRRRERDNKWHRIVREKIFGEVTDA